MGDIVGYLEDIVEILLGYCWDIVGILLGYCWDIVIRILLGYIQSHTEKTTHKWPQSSCTTYWVDTNLHNWTAGGLNTKNKLEMLELHFNACSSSDHDMTGEAPLPAH